MNMTPQEIKTIVIQTVSECTVNKPPRMEFSKKLILGASIFFVLFGIVSVALWILIGEWPQEIAEFFMWPALGIISYMLKSAHENKAKIQYREKEGPHA